MQAREIKKIINAKKKSAPNEIKILKNVFSKYYGEGFVFAVQPPCRRVVTVKTFGYLSDHFWGADFHYNDNFFLSFPHTVFGIRYSQGSKMCASALKVAFTNNMTAKKLYYPPLCNIDNFLQVCLPMSGKNFSTIEEVTKDAIDSFWKTTFNDGMFECIKVNYSAEDMLVDLNKWQSKTKKSISWKPTGRILTEFGPLADFCQEWDFLAEKNYDDDECGNEYGDYY